MLEVDCSELTPDELYALAGAITESLGGSGMAVLKGRKIVLDDLTGSPLDETKVYDAVVGFIARRRDAANYSVEKEGERIVVHSPDPIAAAHAKRAGQLPPNLFKCPFCPFVTPYEEAYVVHYRSHGFGM